MKSVISTKPKSQMVRYASVKDVAEVLEKCASLDELDEMMEKDAILRGILGGLRHFGGGLMRSKKFWGGALLGGAGYGIHKMISGAGQWAKGIKAQRQKQMPKGMPRAY